jgi:DNA-directed RNA polymerase specialized sigma24 family protein
MNNKLTNERRIELRTIDKTVDELIGKEHLYGLTYEPNNSESQEVDSIISSVLNTLSEKEQEIIRRRFFLSETLATIAKAMGVGSERVRQVEARALRKLRHPDRIRKLNELAGLFGLSIGDDDVDYKKNMERNRDEITVNKERLKYEDWIKEIVSNEPLRLLFHA